MGSPLVTRLFFFHLVYFSPDTAILRSEMASVEQKVLVPDEKILSTIFSGASNVTLTSCNIISNTSDTCTFSIHLDEGSAPFRIQ